MIILASILAIAYFLLQWQYVQHWQKLPSPESRSSDHSTFVSIIIPARNEEKHIESCLNSILNQDYPAEQMEVIVVDDYSVDRTSEIVRGIADARVHLIQLNDGNPGGKKIALSKGIELSKGEWLITVDGDCTLSKDAIAASVDYFETRQAKIVTGPVLIDQAHSTIEEFQSLELTGLMLITGSGFESGWHQLANGAFLSFSKESFQEVGGYEGHLNFTSGDDVFLMESIYSKYPNHAYFLKSQDTVALTSPVSDWTSLINQRMRWASKNQGLNNQRITLIWAFVWLYSLLTVVSIIGSVFFISGCFKAVLILFLIKAFSDYYLLSEASTFFKKEKLMRRFIPMSFIHVLFTVYIGVRSSLTGNRFQWKGRKG